MLKDLKEFRSTAQASERKLVEFEGKLEFNNAYIKYIV